MKSERTITTVIPTYRRPELLQQAIQSVLAQSYPHFEVHVWDNASGDETEAVVRRIASEDSRVKYHCHKANIGGIPNFNYGMQHVNSPFFSLLSDDNRLLPDFFEQGIVALTRHPQTMMFAGNTIRVDESGRKLSMSLDRWPSGLVPPPDGLLHIMQKGIPNWESVLFRKDVVTDIGQLNEDFGGAADQDFLMRVAAKHTLCVSKTPLAVFVIHSQSWSAGRNLEELVLTHRRRMAQWFRDDSLSGYVQARLRAASDAKVRKVIVEHVYRKCILGEDEGALRTAVLLTKMELGFSPIAMAVILCARFASYNSRLRAVLSRCLTGCSSFRQKLLVLKDVKI